jgi:hypothetical protein
MTAANFPRLQVDLQGLRVKSTVREQEIADPSDFEKSEKNRAFDTALKHRHNLRAMNSSIQSHHESIVAMKVQVDIIKAELASFDIQDAIDMQLEDERHLTKAAASARSDREQNRLLNDNVIKDLNAEISRLEFQIINIKKEFDDDHKKDTIRQARTSLRELKTLKSLKVLGPYGRMRRQHWNSIRRATTYSISPTHNDQATDANAAETPSSEDMVIDGNHQCNHMTGLSPNDVSTFHATSCDDSHCCQKCSKHDAFASQCSECNLIVCEKCKADLEVLADYTLGLYRSYMMSCPQRADLGLFSLKGFGNMG